MPSVGPDGTVDPKKLAILKNWSPASTLENVLKALQDEMKQNRNLVQPAEGTKY